MNTATELPASVLPGRRRVRLLQVLTITLLCVAFSYAAVFAFQSVLTPLNPFDECITILAARAVANGMTPHGDFWTDYPALTYWIIAAAFKIFGNSYFVARFVSLAFYLAVLAGGWVVSPPRRGPHTLTPRFFFFSF